MSQTQQQGNQHNLGYYRKRFAELNVHNNTKWGPAPHKPILLLSVIELIDQGIIQENKIPVSNDLVNIFNIYWKLLVASSSSYKADICRPFKYLESEGFWYKKENPEGQSDPRTIDKLREAVEYAYLDSTLFDLLQNPFCRLELIDTLVSEWFSTNPKQLEDILHINQTFQNLSHKNEIIEDSETLQIPPKVILRKSLTRNVLFRKAVVKTYDYKCAFCRLKIMRSIRQNIVDAAHIKPFFQFYDNNIGNGISLCKNHHWAFDQGWFAIDNEYKIRVSNDLEEESPNAKPMKDFNGEFILLPTLEQYFPRHEALEWHRLNVFKG